MTKGLTIIDKDYTQWVESLSARYRQSQIKAAVKVNREMLRFYWELGHDIEEMRVEERWGDSVIKNLSADLQRQIPNASGLSARNIYYAKKFYILYASYLRVVPQTVAQLKSKEAPQAVALPSGIVQPLVEQLGDKKVPQPAEQLEDMLFSIPWGRGINKVCEAFRIAGLEEPTFKEFQGGMMVNIPRGRGEQVNDPVNVKNDPINHLSESEIALIGLLKENPHATYSQLSILLSKSLPTTKRMLMKLRDENKIVRRGAKKNGYWEIVKQSK